MVRNTGSDQYSSYSTYTANLARVFHPNLRNKLNNLRSLLRAPGTPRMALAQNLAHQKEKLWTTAAKTLSPARRLPPVRSKGRNAAILMQPHFARSGRPTNLT